MSGQREVKNYCPRCGSRSIVTSKPKAIAGHVRRRRKCVNEACGYNFPTIEVTPDEALQITTFPTKTETES